MDYKDRIEMRQAFEDEYRKHSYDLRRAKDDATRYFHIVTQGHWECWQMAWAKGRAQAEGTSAPPPGPVRRTRTR